VESERWRKIERLYHSALEREANQRADFIQQACGEDESLQKEVRSLLAQSEGDESFLEAPALEVAAKSLARATAAGGPGIATERTSPAAIGRYRIVRVLGEGGMGIVYEAEQDQPRRSVALKVIKPGFATPERLWRFEHESKALGRLQHPGIAQIYEASTADAGFGPQPYFAMELIRGQALLAHADAHQLNARQRLALTAKICDAVQHAHQRGLIHRDLKPGNIVVDETGQPKILDFGVARVTESDAQATRQTDLGQIVGTLAYMSPEQVLGDPQAVDTRSDVYSLGVILYELLSGRLPYDVSRRQLHEAAQTIREEDPTSLSSISRNYRGDIETIVGKALEKDKARRYASAADLAADIQRYLTDEPITARPPSASYQLRKFARRHRALVAGVAAVFVVLAGGIVASTWQAIRANRAGQAALVERDRAVQAEARTRLERDRAAVADQAARRERDLALSSQQMATRERNRALTEKQRADDEAAAAKAVNNFLQEDLLAQASAGKQARPNSRPDPDLKVRTALDRAAAGIEGKFDKQPLVEASIRQTIGATYRDLGIYPEAQRQFERALELRRHVLNDDHPDTLLSIRNLATVYHNQGKFAQAEPLYNKVLEVQRRVLGEQHPDTLQSMFDLAAVYQDQGKLAPAELLFTRVLEARRRVLGQDHPDTLLSMSTLGGTYQLQGKYVQAEPLVSKALELQRSILGEGHPETLLSMNDLASIYRSERKYAQAESLYSQAFEIQRRVLGEEDRGTMFSLNNLAYLYAMQGKYAQAEPLYVKVLGFQRRVLGKEHAATLGTIDNLAGLYADEGKYTQAEPLFVEALEVHRRAQGGEHAYTLRVMTNLASLYATEGRYAEAEPLFTAVLGIRRRVLGEEEPHTLHSMNNLAGLYQLEGKYTQAEPILTKALEVRRRVLGEKDSDTAESMNALALLYRCQGRFAQAEPLWAEAVDVRRRVLGDDHPDTLSSLSDLAALYRKEGKYPAAEALFTTVLEARRRVLGPAHPATTDVMGLLAEVRLQQKQYGAAESLLHEALNNDEKAAVDSWRRFRNQSLLGASLAGQNNYADAESPAVSGYQGMIERQFAMPFEDRGALAQAGERIVQLYESWGKPQKATEWRVKLQTK
jgi:non-specific serine/threonine protein kinase/serine/threonine-protein kinase